MDMIDKSSAYDEMLILSGGVGMSYICRLKSVGLRTEPCGISLGKFLMMEGSSFY